MKYLNFSLLAISFVLMSSSIKTEKASIGYYPGNEFPNISLTGLEGQNLDFNDYKGKKVVLNFWAAYDAPSRVNNIKLSNYLKMNASDVEFISISLDDNISVCKRTALLDEIDMDSQFCDAKGANSKTYKEFNLEKGFKSYLIDEYGVIKAIDLSTNKLRELL